MATAEVSLRRLAQSNGGIRNRGENSASPDPIGYSSSNPKVCNSWRKCLRRGTENRVAVERRRYNEAVRIYNVAVRGFPSNVVASLTGFKMSDAYFQAAGEAKQAPKVQF